MKCPLCIDQRLTVTRRAGIEVDVCPTCNGVWLDRGELEKLVGMHAAPAPASVGSNAWDQPQDDIGSRRAPSPPGHRPDDDRDRYRYRDDDDDDDRDRYRYRDRDDDRYRSKSRGKRRKSKKRRFTDALEDAFEEIFDL